MTIADQVTDARGAMRPRKDQPRPPGDFTATSTAALDAALYQKSPAERHALYTEMGKELARILAGRAVAQMIAGSGMSARAIGAEHGFNHESLSRQANGQSKTGPTLYTLFALAEALGYDLDLTLTKRT